MNLQPPSPKGGLHRSLRVLSLLLIQHALAPTGTDANARLRLPAGSDSDSAFDSESRPYLKISGSLPLRFSPAPRPIPIITKASVETISPQPIAAAHADFTPPALSPSADSSNPLHDLPIAPSEPANTKPVLSILPDDTRPSTRPEDFLPFFKFPGTGDVTVVVPANVATPPSIGQMPASSATYQQR